jgi:hypothetical protein
VHRAPGADERGGLVSIGFGQIPEWCLPSEAYTLQVSGQTLDPGEHSKVLELSPADLVVTVQPGINLSTLNQALAEVNLQVPYEANLLGLQDCNLWQLIGTNLPHPWEGQVGSWRDWILGVKLEQPSGQIVMTGAKVVKSVAGYDLHKMIVGARGCFFCPREITLRLFPRKEMQDYVRKPIDFIQRVWRSDFAQLQASFAGSVYAIDKETCTLYGQLPSHESPTRFVGDFVLRAGCGVANFEITDQTQKMFAERVLNVFDPERKFNPGALGI